MGRFGRRENITPRTLHQSMNEDERGEAVSETVTPTSVESSVQDLPKLGFYTLAGHANSSRELVDEVRLGEAMGFGSVFISERFDKKEAAVLSGAAGAVSDRITIVTAATNQNTRHLMITAGLARTM
jgi:5,10-methylenetetrahydromethanopterin reductase